jgi:DNA-binding IclR family transcriptional regulator
VVAELGIADLLADRPMSAAQLAQATASHEPSLYRVLRLLVALGVLLEEQDGCFGLTVVGEQLRSAYPHPAYVRFHCLRTLLSLWVGQPWANTRRRRSSPGP